MNKLPKEALNPQNPFTTFDLKFSSAEQAALDEMNINYTKSYDNFGNLTALKNETKEFLKSLGQSDAGQIEIISNLITNLVNTVISSFEKATAWVTIRASLTTDTWDLPRWHTDGYYYAPYSGEQYKAVITLKGPGSLFYPLPNELRQQFNSLQLNPDNRAIIAKLLDPAKAISIDIKKGVIFIVGADYAAVHSEPPIHESRLFLSIVPGSKTEIDELYKNWHSEK
ncbi:MAG: hypothetical protein V4501_12650 [Pseudomonadota bacterium]